MLFILPKGSLAPKSRSSDFTMDGQRRMHSKTARFAAESDDSCENRRAIQGTVLGSEYPIGRSSGPVNGVYLFVSARRRKTMSRLQLFAVRRAGPLGAFSAVLLYVGAAAAYAQQDAPAASGEIGRIEFGQPSSAKKFVEVDLSPAMIGDLFGIGDAALTGVADALQNSPQAKEGSQAIQFAAQKALAVRELVAIAKNTIQSVRVRAYDDLENPAQEQATIAAHFSQQLKSSNWENVVRAQEGDKSVQISAIHADGAIRGLFIIAAERNKLVLVNVICDISPENARRLAGAAVKSGLEAGLEKHLEEALKHMK
jgi:hypothetical protein